jgi:hypothetical protein
MISNEIHFDNSFNNLLPMVRIDMKSGSKQRAFDRFVKQHLDGKDVRITGTRNIAVCDLSGKVCRCLKLEVHSKDGTIRMLQLGEHYREMLLFHKDTEIRVPAHMFD